MLCVHLMVKVDAYQICQKSSRILAPFIVYHTSLNIFHT